jgi:hypothetical protein
MMTRDSFRRTLLCLLALSVALEGFLGVIPHDHVGAVAPDQVCDNPHCPDPLGAHLDSVGSAQSDHVCLACSAHAVQLLATDAPAWLEIGECVPAGIVAHDAWLSIPDRWSLPLRGPPAFA